MEKAKDCEGDGDGKRRRGWGRRRRGAIAAPALLLTGQQSHVTRRGRRATLQLFR
jgi:hypothetical protein